MKPSRMTVFFSLQLFAAFSISSALMFGLSGCSTIRGFPEPPRTANVDPPNVDWELGPNAIKVYNNSEADPAKQKQVRNEIIDARIAALDSAFGDYERSVYAEDVRAGIGADFLLLGLTATTTVAGAASTKAALGAASTAVAGASASFDKRALFDKTLPALLSQMVGARETIRAQIAKSKSLAVGEYSLASAESDLERFQYAGSIVGAIASFTQDAGQKAVAAKQQVQDITNAKYEGSANSALLQNFWKPSGTVNNANEQKLKKWMEDNGFATTDGDMTMFIYANKFDAQRTKAVKDLGLGSTL